MNFCENASLSKIANLYVLLTCEVWGIVPGIGHISIEEGFLASFMFLHIGHIIGVFSLDESPEVFWAYRAQWETLFHVPFPWLLFPLLSPFPKRGALGGCVHSPPLWDWDNSDWEWYLWGGQSQNQGWKCETNMSEQRQLGFENLSLHLLTGSVTLSMSVNLFQSYVCDL